MVKTGENLSVCSSYFHLFKKSYITKEEKERKVVELYKKGANIRQISKRVKMSISDIGRITRMLSGDPEPIANTKKLSKHSHALELFRTKHSNLDVATKVGLTDKETEEEHKHYRRLIGMDRFCDFYDGMEGNLDYLRRIHQPLRLPCISELNKNYNRLLNK